VLKTQPTQSVIISPHSMEHIRDDDPDITKHRMRERQAPHQTPD